LPVCPAPRAEILAADAFGPDRPAPNIGIARDDQQGI